MGVPSSEVGYTPTMPRGEDHEVHKGHVVALEKKEKKSLLRFVFKAAVCKQLLHKFVTGTKQISAAIVNKRVCLYIKGLGQRNATFFDVT